MKSVRKLKQLPQIVKPFGDTQKLGETVRMALDKAIALMRDVPLINLQARLIRWFQTETTTETPTGMAANCQFEIGFVKWAAWLKGVTSARPPLPHSKAGLPPRSSVLITGRATSERGLF